MWLILRMQNASPSTLKEHLLQFSAIEYEAFEKMVAHQFNRLFDEIENRWPVSNPCASSIASAW